MTPMTLFYNLDTTKMYRYELVTSTKGDSKVIKYNDSYNREIQESTKL